MSITSAYMTSRSGLTVAAGQAELASSNIANAGRAGYVRRDAATSEARFGGGAEITAIRRDVDLTLQSRQRIEGAGAAFQTATASGLAVYTRALGEPGDGRNLGDRIGELQSRLDLLSAEPGDANAQAAVVRAAAALSDTLNESARAADTARETAGNAIDADILEANDLLGDIAALDSQIRLQPGGDMSAAGLRDRRDAALERLSQIMDVRVQTRSDGGIDLHAAGGAALVEDGEAATLVYDPGSGTLSAGGVDVTPGREGARGISTGSLSAQIVLRDQTLPEMAAALDELARGVIATFEAADASLAPGQAGLFTDAGGALDPAATGGLAGRIAVNDAVRPEAGGDVRRVRDGIGAPAAGAESDPTQVLAFSDALSGTQSFDASFGFGGSVRVGDFAARLISDQAGATSAASSAAEAQRAAVASIAAERAAAEGVNIDDELQKLLAIEQSYAANSQVITALTRMVDTLLAAV
ncbi:flagellar hook-associated protein FlgK [Roseivivax isoporae]|uniref:Flagellar hook-associated protein 1 n=1 Tax=Roseivivax isoporae LMG 25204 TaxID=1449351 RepID=X7F7I0_9RHOB|nr:flagellar hook-associated protein FlgK [Roseivivax isoporae]ETX28892.1 hypothetical protein RISW2_04055 [Roseivivax isoporae LMG 25204]